MTGHFGVLGLWATVVTVFAGNASAGDVKHVDVYRVAGRFGGWPANHGIWIWGDEILVGFSAGYFKDNGPDRHAIDHDKPEEFLMARSSDGGAHWSIENPAAKGALIPRGEALHGITPPGLEEKPWRDCPGGIDFTHPGFALIVLRTGDHNGASRFYYSTDRGHNWEGPFRIPQFGQQDMIARTDYLIEGKHEMTLFLTAGKSNGREGRPLCVRTFDGGKTWKLLSFIGLEPQGFSIMPSSVRLSENEILTAVRRREGPRRWIDAWRSTDNGGSWQPAATPVADAGEGNPPAMIRLHDGRVCITYGYRAAPFGIRARLSEDGGRTWGPEIHLRDDGGGRDLGYCRSVQRPDGKVVTIYYYNDDPNADRYIAATIWEPESH